MTSSKSCRATSVCFYRYPLILYLLKDGAHLTQSKLLFRVREMWKLCFHILMRVDLGLTCGLWQSNEEYIWIIQAAKLKWALEFMKDSSSASAPELGGFSSSTRSPWTCCDCVMQLGMCSSSDSAGLWQCAEKLPRAFGLLGQVDEKMHSAKQRMCCEILWKWPSSVGFKEQHFAFGLDWFDPSSLVHVRAGSLVLGMVIRSPTLFWILWYDFSILNSSWRAGSDSWACTWSMHPMDCVMGCAHPITPQLGSQSHRTWGLVSHLKYHFPYFTPLPSPYPWSVSWWLSDPSHTKSLWWALSGIHSCPSSCTRPAKKWVLLLVWQKPQTPLPKACIPWVFIQRSGGSGSGCHLLSPILVPFVQLYHCLSGLLGLHSSWICVHHGCKNVVQSLMLAGSHVLLNVCLETLNLLLASLCQCLALAGSLPLFAPQMLCWFPFPRSSRSMNFPGFPCHLCCCSLGRGVCVHVHPRL